MKLKFTKMHGAGNDFIVLDGINQAIALSAADYRRLADRHFGIGADQILLVEAAADDTVDFSYRIFNADGGEVEQCGNGARAFVRFVAEKGLSSKRTIRVATQRGVVAPSLQEDGSVAVDMGAPEFEPARIPFHMGALVAEQVGNAMLWPVNINGRIEQVTLVSMGNPHAVMVVDSIDAAAVASDGAALQENLHFPNRVNVGFLQIVDRRQVRLRVFERGAGETLACGTGACAAVVAGIRMGLLDSPVSVAMRGGQLQVDWDGRAGAVTLTGPAVTVFEGEIVL